jgi:hypothetical protein
MERTFTKELPVLGERHIKMAQGSRREIVSNINMTCILGDGRKQ